MMRPLHIVSCSGGKDSVATILLAAQHGEPMDEIVFAEVMFDKKTTGGAVALTPPKQNRATLRSRPVLFGGS